MDHAGRREKLRKLLKKSGAEALLVSSAPNVTYLTGFTGDSSYLLVTQQKEILISDGRFNTQIEQECPGLEMDIRPAGILIHEQTIKILRAAKIARLAIEAETMTVAMRDRIAEKLPKMAIGHTLGMVELLRQVKDKEELALIREAIEIAQQSFAAMRASIEPRRPRPRSATPWSGRFGSWAETGRPSRRSSPPAARRAAARQHGRRSRRRQRHAARRLGAQWKLYKSDLTRVLVTGKISAKLRRVYDVVLTAQARAIAAIRPGAETTAVQRRGPRGDRGRRSQPPLQSWHRARVRAGNPRGAADVQNNPVALQPGMVITVEPGVYLPGWGGIRIEDDILVTRGGHEVLTSAETT